MPRRARPWYRSERSSFWAVVKGQRMKLLDGDDTPQNYRLAEAELSRIIQTAANEAARLSLQGNRPAPPSQSQSVTEAVAVFLARTDQRYAAGKIGKHHRRNTHTALGQFGAFFGERPLTSLNAEVVEGWAATAHTEKGMPWSSSYANGALGVVLSLLKANKVVLDPPLVRPPKESRGAAVCLTDDQFALVLDRLYLRKGVKGDLRELLRLMRATGARPAEVCGLSVEGVDWSNCSILLNRHKTWRKTGRPRPLVFNSEAMNVLNVQRERYGSGLLFRTARTCKAYSPNVIVKQLLKVSARVGFRVIAYGLGRHAFATQALVNGVPDTMVAALLGHTSTTMVHRNYSHVSSNARAMAAAAEKVVNRAG